MLNKYDKNMNINKNAIFFYMIIVKFKNKNLLSVR